MDFHICVCMCVRVKLSVQGGDYLSSHPSALWPEQTEQTVPIGE